MRKAEDDVAVPLGVYKELYRRRDGTPLLAPATYPPWPPMRPRVFNGEILLVHEDYAHLTDGEIAALIFQARVIHGSKD